MNEESLHIIQMSILTQLAFAKSMRFSDFKIMNISNDHLSYHLKVLQDSHLISKDKSTYMLTAKGKQFVSIIDKETKQIEKSPRVTVIIIVEREINNEKELLIQTRTKEPFYEFAGFVAGKMKYGETVEESAKRELFEETNLQAGTIEHQFILHEMFYKNEADIFTDTFINVVCAKNCTGDLLEKCNEGINSWISVNEFKNHPKLFVDEVEIYELYEQEFRGFTEKKYFNISF